MDRIGKYQFRFSFSLTCTCRPSVGRELEGGEAFANNFEAADRSTSLTNFHGKFVTAEAPPRRVRGSCVPATFISLHVLARCTRSWLPPLGIRSRSLGTLSLLARQARLGTMSRPDTTPAYRTFEFSFTRKLKISNLSKFRIMV